MIGVFKILAVFSALHCPVPEKIIRPGAEPWNEKDDKILESAKVGCAQNYNRSPCVIKIYKFKNQHYHVICGHEMKEKTKVPVEKTDKELWEEFWNGH
jgi:hypothetical protein